MKFSIRDLLWLTAVVALSLALVYVKWPSPAGRYQMLFYDQPPDRVFIVDTSTGKIWVQRFPAEEWYDYKTPDYGK